MKVNTKVLVKFLKKARMTGTQSLMEGILRFDKDGLKIIANSQSSQSRVIAWLFSNAFEEYESIGNVGLNDLENVVKVLDRFGENVTLKKEGNLLTIKGEGKSVEIELINENFLQTDSVEPNLTYSDTFDIKSEKLHSIVKDVQLNKDAVIVLKTVEKCVMFTNTGKYKFTNTLDAPMCKGGVNVKFGQVLIDCVAELDGALQFSVGTDYPCKIIEKLEKSIITIIVSPYVDSEEE